MIPVGPWHYEAATGLYTRHDDRGQCVAQVFRSAHKERGAGWYRHPFAPPIEVDEVDVPTATATCDRGLAPWTKEGGQS